MKNLFSTKFFTLSVFISLNFAVLSQRDLGKTSSNSSHFSNEELFRFKNEAYGNYNPESEIISLRDANSKHFINPDGSVTVHMASGLIHYYEDDQWRPIYHTIENNPQGGFQNLNNSFKTFYPEKANGQIITQLSKDLLFRDMVDMRMYFTSVNGELASMNISESNGQVDFNVINYENVYSSNIDLRLTQNSSSRKMDYILKSPDILNLIPSEAEYLVFEEKVVLSKGMTSELMNNVIRIRHNGSIIMTYPRPVIKELYPDNYNYETVTGNKRNYDSEFSEPRYEGIYEINQLDNILTIKLKVSTNWLLNENRSFPIEIDPTADYTPSNIAYWTGSVEARGNACGLADIYNNTGGYFNYSNWILYGAYMYGYNGPNYDSQRFHGWSKFDISSIPDYALISDVFFTSEVVYDYIDDPLSMIGMTINSMEPDPVTGDWDSRLADIKDGTTYTVLDGSGINFGTLGVKVVDLNSARTDIQNDLPLDWFAIGLQPHVYSYCGDLVDIAGYDQVKKPYLSITYTTPAPAISSISDASVCAGSSIIITGTNFTGVTAVSIGGTPASSFTVNSSTEIVAIGASGSSGTVSVTTAGGTANSSSSVTINALPTAVSVTGDGNICENSTLSASNGSSGTIYWQGTTSGGTDTANPTNTSPAITTTGTYYFRARSSEGCWGTEGPGNVTSLTSSPANALAQVTDASVCEGIATSLQGSADASSGHSLSSSHCSSTGNMTYGTSVRSFNFSGGSVGISNSTGVKTATYENFTASVSSAQVLRGDNCTMTMNLDTDGAYTCIGRIWIDWDNNDTFDSDELYEMGNVYNQSNGQTSNGSVPVVVPADATIGTHRIRVTGKYSTGATVCLANFDGEVEDYSIIVNDDPLTYSWSSSPAGFVSSDQNPNTDPITENTDFILTVTNSEGCSATATTSVTSSAVTPGTIESSIDGGTTYGSAINTRQVGNDIYWDYTGSDFHSFEYSWDNGSTAWNTDFILTDPGSWGNAQNAGADGTLSIRAKAQCGTSVDYTNTVQTDWVYNYGGNGNAPTSAVTASLSGTPSSLSNGGDMRIDQTVTFVKPSTSFESTNYAFQYEWNNDGNWSGDWVTGQNAVWSDNIGSNVSSGDAVLTVRTRHYGSGNDSYSAEYAVTLKKPVISTSGSLSAFSNCSGGASSAQSFNVSGSYLGSDVTITAPTGFELSESSGGTYTSSITLSPTNGTLASMAVFIRLTSSASGTPNGNVVCTATAATTVNVAASATVGSAPVITSASSFTGTTTCGVMSIDISVDTDGATGTWADGSNGLFVIGESETTNTYATNTYNTPLTLTWTNSSGAACANATATITARFNQPSPTGSMDTDSWVWGGLSNSTWTTGSNWYKWDGYKWLKQGASYPDAGSKIYVLPTSDVCVSSTLNNAATSLGDVNIQSGGSFDLGSTNTSITGNITNDGTMQGGTGTVTLSGSTDQTISGTGTINFNNLTVNKSSGSAIISTQTDIRNTLTMTKGNIVNSQPVVLGVNSSNPGTLSHASGTVTGELRRYFANATGSTFFPVGTSSNMRDVTINFTQPPGTDEYLTVSYLSGAPALGGSEGAYSGLPLVTSDNQLIQNYSADGHWNIDPTGGLYESTEINNANYEMTLHCKALSIQPTDVSKVRIIKSAGSENSSINHVTWTGLDLLSSSGSPADFTITAAAQGFSKFGAGSDDGNALPVELVSFNGSCNDGVVELNWETASEYNSSHFDVENSRDGITWDVVKTIDAAGNSNELLTYTYGDVSAHGGDNYYRLHQVDIDGTSKTYDVINVSCSQTTSGYFSIFPNPSSGSFQVILNNAEIIGDARMNVVDTKGNMVLSKSLDVKSGINMYVVNEVLAPGIYYVSVQNGDKVTVVLKHSVK